MHCSSIVTINYCDFLLTGSLHLSVYDEDESLLQGHLDIPKSAISERWTGLPLCPSRSSNDFVKKYLTFSGTPGVRFTVEASQDYEIELNEPKMYHIFEWNTVNVFQFIPPKDISKTQLDITVTSESDVPAYLKVSQNCQDVKDNIRLVDYRGKSSRLTFARKGRITLSKASIPPLTADSTASWYIGVALNNAAGTTPLNASKTGTLMVTKSFNYSYGGPMLFICLVPFVFGGVVAVWALYCFKERHVSPLAYSHIVRVSCKDVCRAMCKVLCTYWFAGGHKTYSYMTCIVGSVLMVGAFQFVYANWYLMIQEGDRDDCYYNDFCYRVSNYDIPFNSMSSNFVYIVHAFILALSVWYMESELLARCKKIAENAECNSTEAHKRKISFSIGYAFSWALLFEGLFSMLYHLCPTKMTFQFDLAFMFVISGLIVVVMYNGILLNHAGETGGHVGASNFYLGFIVPLYILNYIGSLNHSKEGLIPTAAWATLLALWVFFIFNWVGYKLYLHNWSLLTFWCWVKCCKRCCADSRNRIEVCKFICLMISLILAVLMFSLFSVTTFKFIGSLPHALLFACITESVIVICWKLGKSCYCMWRDGRYKKFICVITYVLTTLALGSSALVFFIGFPTTDKAETPEISRNKNHKCIIDFYDYHDLWHILSSFALLMGVHIVMFASYDPDTIARGDVISNYGATTSDANSNA